EYHRVTFIACHESGVLWAATENGVEKILYDKGVSLFGQRLGLSVSWPQLTSWNNRVVIVSGGRLYEELDTADSTHTHFELVPGPKEVWGLAASGPHLLVANSSGIFAPTIDHQFEPVLTGVSVDRLVMTSPNFCYFIGASEIGALRWENGRWSECAPRIPGLGYPSNVLATQRAAWIELGAYRAARITYKNGQLQSRVFENFPWRESHWINISAIGSTVVLNSAPDGRIFFDEETEKIVDAPKLQALFDQAPATITRIYRDDKGVIWASYDRGVMLATEKDGRYTFDTTTFDTVNERWPTIHFLVGKDIWFSTGQSLYHVDRHVIKPAPTNLKPLLVSVVHEEARSEVSKLWPPQHQVAHFSYPSNSISFRFFAGTYTSRLPPVYEFRLSDSPHTNWTSSPAGPPLTLSNLHEGAYQLEVRMLFNGSPVGEPLSLSFIIDPPWYHTWYAYVLYAIAAASGVFGLVQWFVHRTRVHNVILENLVKKRTDELRSAMEKLGQETKNAAILAERGRLAGEIHDSLQQGLSGLILQLDATLKMPGLTPEVRSRINTARSMVSFSRHEVQNAIWDLESPLLEGVELTQALQKLINLISVGPARVALIIEGNPIDLSQATQHHLLRIAQEALTNAVRHAEATLITIKLVYKEKQVELVVEDDGKGFETNRILSKGIGHFGLRGLKVRADKIGADLSVISTPGQGTCLRIVVGAAESLSNEIYATVRPD
ncbi:MAG TPA: sensor histidine kinase, partial [Opitutaceae bacterium]